MASAMATTEGRPSDERNLELIRLAKGGDQAAMNTLLIANEGLIGYTIGLMKRPFPPNLDTDELMQVGRLTLMKCVEKFDPSRGFRFSTYVTCAMRRNLIREVMLAKRRGEREVCVDTDFFDFEARESDRTGQMTAAIRGYARAEKAALAECSQQLEFFDGDEADAKNRRDWRMLVERFIGGKTLKAIADEEGLSKERVRQRNNDMMAKIRRHMKAPSYA